MFLTSLCSSLSPIDKKKTSTPAFNISDVIVNTELSSKIGKEIAEKLYQSRITSSRKIGTSKWNNQANIATPEFKRLNTLESADD